MQEHWRGACAMRRLEDSLQWRGWPDQNINTSLTSCDFRLEINCVRTSIESRTKRVEFAGELARSDSTTLQRLSCDSPMTLQRLFRGLFSDPHELGRSTSIACYVSSWMLATKRVLCSHLSYSSVLVTVQRHRWTNLDAEKWSAVRNSSALFSSICSRNLPSVNLVNQRARRF